MVLGDLASCLKSIIKRLVVVFEIFQILQFDILRKPNQHLQSFPKMIYNNQIITKRYLSVFEETQTFLRTLLGQIEPADVL